MCVCVYANKYCVNVGYMYRMYLKCVCLHVCVCDRVACSIYNVHVHVPEKSQRAPIGGRGEGWGRVTPTQDQQNRHLSCQTTGEQIVL